MGAAWVIVSPCAGQHVTPWLDRSLAAIPNRIMLSSSQMDLGLWDDLFCISHSSGIRVGGARPSSLQLALKRGLDILLTLCILIIGSAALALLCFLMRVNSRGRIFYGQKRVGRRGREFTAWKFRTMVMNADQVLDDYLARNPAAKAEWDHKHKLSDDPRVTMIGKFLRTTSLDELPQLWNVLRGDMSLVGPRPVIDSPTYDAAYIYDYPDEFEAYKTVRPGLTGLWQVSSRSSLMFLADLLSSGKLAPRPSRNPGRNNRASPRRDRSRPSVYEPFRSPFFLLTPTTVRVNRLGPPKDATVVDKF